MAEVATVWALLSGPADDSIALAAPGRMPLTFGDLRGQVADTIETLNQRGIGRGDRIAIVLPNGPEMASAFLSVASGATTAPLNPGYKHEEFLFYLSDLGVSAVIVHAGDDSPVRAAAGELGVPVLELHITSDAPAGRFTLKGDGPGGEAELAGLAEPDDIALVLHTSGTTSLPKIVPLAHRNLVASADNIRTTLELTRRDRCMNVMPLFHIHGLMAATLAPLSVGASVYCTPGFNALRFFSWLDEAKPSYYTAVPTMHQAILARAGRNKESLAKAQLRFVRSSSAALPPTVMTELENTFGAPVVEAYGMTEAAHQMSCNPLPPGERKPGMVGIAAGPEVAIMDAAGALLPSGSVGEIVIRGSNVIAAYENNPEANRASFTDGWFRTGDQGMMDGNGYLTLTGRLKEIINRGGEKVSPREVDEVLMEHPAVQQVVTFALPHDKLGEEVAAAVVLREGMEVTTSELREFAATRLAAFKVPRRVLVLDEIPKGPTGKLRRIGMAKQLALV